MSTITTTMDVPALTTVTLQGDNANIGSVLVEYPTVVTISTTPTDPPVPSETMSTQAPDSNGVVTVYDLLPTSQNLVVTVTYHPPGPTINVLSILTVTAPPAPDLTTEYVTL